MVGYEEAPLRAFHWRVAVAAFGGVFSDGYGLGIIGISLGLASSDLALTPLWLGLLGAASLFGLFFGALFTGPVADRLGRRPIFAWNMALLTLFSVLQFFVDSRAELLGLRFLIGLLLGTDYVVSKALLTEFTPREFRGRIMGSLSVAWAAGYAAAFAIGVALASTGADAWRWMLATSAVPCLLIGPLRWSLPESPLWLAAQGRHEESARIVRERVGTEVAPPVALARPPAFAGRWSQLFSATWRRHTLVGATFFVCQVIPYFALGTFVARVLAALNVAGSNAGGLFYNGALVAGAVLGMLFVDRWPRRVALIGSFTITAAALLPLALLESLPAFLIIALFAIFAGVLSAASNLCYVYLPELFPTDLRASGIGLAIAASRIGSALSTFLLPVLVAGWGVRPAVGACVAVLAVGAVACYLWAPETRRTSLSAT